MTTDSVEIEGHDLKLTLWYHDPDHLRSALCFDSHAEWKPKYHVLDVISSGSFNLAALDRVEPCVPPIRRRPTETTRQFIERAMRENHGYTVPAALARRPRCHTRRRHRRTAVGVPGRDRHPDHSGKGAAAETRGGVR